MRPDERGVVYVETVAALVPVLLLFVGALQFGHASASFLIVERAASAAARAAIVVLPDDGRFYGDEGNAHVNEFSGLRKDDIVRAAENVLSAAFPVRRRADKEREVKPRVSVSGAFAGFAPLTATVEARYACFPGVFGFMCGVDREIAMRARSTLPYQGADFDY
jgi:hypothetical protein